ncbi:SRPBCC family protein [Actinoplanes sp. LDG1-06]|uniref:SRPBCC family protein n=1 Tax=Paractinoplanes ovalisporus TaxID=2810368 RepID=A0ABS2A7Q5_9ACTN|nr:SRPBCC family protein [Actinoplanes ovalisporus]MBM2615866.1 SRPBCC family protein [Actinoplanes ovalisporus]
MRRALEVVGKRDAGEVWERYVRPDRWAEWSPQIRSVEFPEATLRAGLEGVVHGPAGVRARFRVLRVDAPRAWSWVVRAGGVQLTLWHTVEAVAGGTRTLLAVEGPAPVVLLYLPVARFALTRLVSG